jgi:hypothetical protein
LAKSSNITYIIYSIAYIGTYPLRFLYKVSLFGPYPTLQYHPSSVAMESLKAVLYEVLPFTYSDINYYAKKVASISSELSLIASKMQLPSLKSMSFMTISQTIKLLLWLAVWQAFVYVDFGSFFVVITGIALIFLNLGEKKDPSELSAYSVFNKDQQRMMGSLTADQFEREIMHTNHNHGEDEDRD